MQTLTSTKVILSFEIGHLINRVVSVEQDNIKVADVCRQLLLLSQMFNTNLCEVVSLLFNMYKDPYNTDDTIKQTLPGISQLFVSTSMDSVITDLMENYPFLLNNMFDHKHFMITGIVRLTDRETFLNHFTHPEEVDTHYDFIQLDSVIQTLLKNGNELLAFILDYISFTKYSDAIYKRIADFFFELYLEMKPFLEQNRNIQYFVSPDTRVDFFGSQLLIVLEKL